MSLLLEPTNGDLCFSGGAEARIGEAAEAGAEDGGCRLEEAARPRTRLPVHRLRPERSLQLRRDATAGKKFGRTSARTTARSFLSVDHPKARISGEIRRIPHSGKSCLLPEP